MVLADRIRQLRPSAILASEIRARELRARGESVISFGAGIPDFDTPERIKDAAREAMRRGHTKLTDASGIVELRKAISAKFRRDNGLSYEPDEIIVCSGAKHVLFNLMMVMINPGDEVIIPKPYWVSYPDQVRLVGGVPVYVETHESNGFDLDPSRVRAALTRRTKLIVLNSPNNPTGAVFSPESLRAVAEIAVEHDVWVASDETYEMLAFDERHMSVASFGPEIKSRSIVINTCSKSYAMTGWRIGYAGGPRELVRAMSDVQGQVTVCPSSVGQWAAIEALNGPQDEIARMTCELKRRRAIMVDGLNNLPGIRCGVPKGTFYAFANVSGLLGRRTPEGRVLEGSLDVANFFIDHAKVATVPGLDFGSDVHLRLSYGTSEDVIREGLDRMGAAIKLLS